MATTLTRNIVELPLKRREKLISGRDLPTLRAKTMKDPRIIAWIRGQDIDLVINLRTRCIYRSEVLDASKLGCINIHHGLLPLYRGAMCDLFALSENRPAGFFPWGQNIEPNPKSHVRHELPQVSVAKSQMVPLAAILMQSTQSARLHLP